MAHKKAARQKLKPRIRRRTPPGAVPGSLVADPAAPRPRIRVVAYGADHFLEQELSDVAQVASWLGKHPVLWVDVEGLGDAEAVRALGKMFNLHSLALEDVLNPHQRAKVEEYENCLFLVAHLARLGEHVQTEQMSCFLGKDFVVTFLEQPDGCFAPIRERLRTSAGRLREAGTDDLVYALLDAAVDTYFPTLDHLGDRLDAVDDLITANNPHDAMERIRDLRSDLLLLRRAIWPHRDAIGFLTRTASEWIDAETRVYLRDCLDHTSQIIDLLETYRDMCSDSRDYCLSTISNRLNETMKVLTIISTIFIPLSFVAGLYGMNFDTAASPWNMPELKWALGYPFALTIMVSIAIGMIFFFWRRGWLRNE